MNVRLEPALRKWWFPALAFLAAVVVTFRLQHTMEQTTGWNKPEIYANVWIAIGTIALAMVTAWSVFRTNDVIKGEDRRHQAGYAPLVIIRETRLDGGVLHFDIENVGMGIARDIEITTTLEWRSWQFQAGVIPQAYYPAREVNLQKTLSVLPIAPIAISLLEVPMGAQPEMYYNQCHVGVVHIAYTDIFGNTYRTYYKHYSDDANFMWESPANLKPPSL